MTFRELMLGDRFRFLDGKSDHIKLGAGSYTVGTRVVQIRKVDTPVQKMIDTISRHGRPASFVGA